MADLALLPLRAFVEANRSEIREVVGRHRGLAVALFGSVARGEETADSDIDLLVEFESGSSLFDLVRLKAHLTDVLGRDVDVVSVGALKERDRGIRADSVWL